jgi:ubiquinone biosynthesis protein
MLERLSPQARLKDVGEGLRALGRAVQELPNFVRNTEIISSMLASGGLKLHPETARQIAEAQMHQTRVTRTWLWLVAAAAGIGAVIWRLL